MWQPGLPTEKSPVIGLRVLVVAVLMLLPVLVLLVLLLALVLVAERVVLQFVLVVVRHHDLHRHRDHLPLREHDLIGLVRLDMSEIIANISDT